jgi:hypothetical protein
MTSINTQPVSKARLWTGRVLGALVTLAFLGSGITKLAHVPQVIAQLTHAGEVDPKGWTKFGRPLDGAAG